MKLLLSIRVHIAWTLIVIALCASIVVIWKLVQDAPPANSILITSSQDTNASGGKNSPINAVTSTSRHATTVPASGLHAGPTAITSQRAAIADMRINAAPMMGTATKEVSVATSTPEMIAVYVSGAVQKPGVYTLPLGSRIFEAVSAAGGSIVGANLDSLNLAQRLSDEDHISVPRIGDTPQPVSARLPSATPHKRNTPHPTSAPLREPTSVSVVGKPLPTDTTPTEEITGQPRPTQQEHKPTPQTDSVPAEKININTANAQELQALPGIGPSLAGKIVAYRAANGPFQAIEDIMRVPGIKEGIFAKVRDYITVAP